MNQRILDHYRSTSTYTYAGPYAATFQSLPDRIPELGRLVYHQIIHRMFLAGMPYDSAYGPIGDLTEYPWYRMRCEDDVLLTAAAMTAELFRLDGRGFHTERAVADKLVVTCRYAAVLMAAILKAKGIPCRCRSGFLQYFDPTIGYDHWINQYWNEAEGRWVNVDVHAYIDRERHGLDQFDVPDERFGYGAQVWLGIRKGRLSGGNYHISGTDIDSLRAAVLALFYDFHALMNNEISYLFRPSYVDLDGDRFERLTEEELAEIDGLCEKMLEPDRNFDALLELWNTRRKFRILNSPLVSNDSIN